jgi:hypothetical protein
VVAVLDGEEALDGFGVDGGGVEGFEVGGGRRRVLGSS